MVDTRRFGVRLDTGFDPLNEASLSAALGMAMHTIIEEQLGNGFTLTLDKSELGQWRITLQPVTKGKF